MARSAESRSWFSRLTLQAKVVVTVMVVLLVGGAGRWAYLERYTCGPDLDVIDGQCIGVTDGSYLFDPDFADVQKKIADENAWVRRQPSYVTVALLNPLTATATSSFSTEHIRNQLEGAYTAQYRINHTTVVGDSRPPIQLLLANEGPDQKQWQPVVRQLVKMADGDNPLVAVVGMGSSVIQTEQAARELSNHRIPMVGALLNADQLEYSHIPGLIRVTPSVQDYVKAVRGYLDSRADLDSAILVYDSNSDFDVDLFTKALRENLNEQMGHLMRDFRPQGFLGGLLADANGGLLADANAGLFGPITANICAAAAEGLKVVLYAGRRGDLDGFLDALEDRVCQSTPLIVMTGTDPHALLNGREQQLSAANLTVVFPGRTDVSGWNQNVPGTPEHYQDFRRAFTEKGKGGFDAEHLDDRSIMTHDAVLTAVKAVQLAAPGGSAPTPGAPTARAVFSQLLNLNNLYTVPGASGPLIFGFRAQAAGNPQGKQVLVFQVPPPTDGPSRQVGPPYFTPYGP